MNLLPIAVLVNSYERNAQKTRRNIMLARLSCVLDIQVSKHCETRLTEFLYRYMEMQEIYNIVPSLPEKVLYEYV